MTLDIEKILKNSTSSDWKADVSVFLQFTRPFMMRLVAAVFFSLLLASINGAIAWSVKPALDWIFVIKSESYLIALPFAIIGLFLLRGISTYLAKYLMNSIGAKVVQLLRQAIFDKLLVMPQSYFGRTSSGSVVSKVLNDVEILQNIFAATVKDFFVAGGTVIVLSIVAFTRKWDLALISFIVMPLIAYSIGRLGVRMKKTSAHTRKLISRVTRLLHESLLGIKIIKAFTMEKGMSDRYRTALTDHYRNVMREIRIRGFSALMVEILGGVGVAVIVYYGGHLVISGDISPGTFFSFVTALLMIYTPLKRLSSVHNNFQQARTILDRVREIAFVEPEKSGGIEKRIKGNIEFQGVSFRYPKNRDVALKNIDMKIREGELIALVGHSGAGKSTLIELIAGFWYPTEGNIIIDGINIKDLSLKSLRQHIGLVTQDIILFNETIRTNLLLGKPNASDEEIVEAAQAAYAHEFIEELSEGYETKIGERGVRLSGGQKQRITIARAILKNPEILIFDEATSSLDSESESKIQKAIDNIIPGRTTIIIAHRLSTIRKADRILVMDRGNIIQDGQHDDLLVQDGIYRELYQIQFEPE
ncbi:MAG: ABC transporter ATP-binding protein [Nitrospiraceae bacterium]|nr:MAG: ABC transporter ATP-binding protein [Nitrospiraceae bacterium]